MSARKSANELSHLLQTVIPRAPYIGNLLLRGLRHRSFMHCHERYSRDEFRSSACPCLNSPIGFAVRIHGEILAHG